MSGKTDIKKLAQLSNKDFFAEIEKGLNLCLVNAKRIYADFEFLKDQSRNRGAAILALAAAEEAVKVLIFLAAVRCPCSPKEISRQLGYFTNHLAKLIYAQYSASKPGTFGELRRYSEIDRRKYYLDGPNGIDWIFYNAILWEREETIYVDYSETDDQRTWHDPAWLDDFLPWPMHYADPILRLINALDETGFFVSPAFEVIAQVWQSVKMTDEFTWDALRELNAKTLEELEKRALLRTKDNNLLIINEWLFPLYDLNLNDDRTEEKDLKSIRENWQRDLWP